MPNISWLIVIIGALGNVIIGYITFSRDSKSATNRWFGIFSFLFALYLIVNQFYVTEQDHDRTLFWVRTVLVIAPLIVFSFFMLVNVFPKQISDISRPKIVIASIITSIVICLGTTPLIFKDVLLENRQPVIGPLVFVFVLYNIIFISWSIFVLIRKFRRSEGLEKKQIKYFLIGALLMFSLILITNVILVVLLGISSLVVLVPLYTLVFVGMVSYAIVRFGLFDVQLIATEATTIVLWVVLFSKLFTTQNSEELSVEVAVLVVVTIFGILLVRSVKHEFEQKQQLQKLNKRLEELDDQKDEFVNVAAHELRAPMTAIKGYLSMIEEGDAGEVSEKVKEFLNEAVEGNERLIRLVNNMLNVSRIEEGRMVYNMGEVDLNDVVKTVVHEYKEQAEEKKLDLNLVTSDKARYPVYVDKDRIYEVMSNLISNALKYTDKGSVTVKVHLTSHQTIRVDIIDTGLGMTKEELGKLFQKFYRAESNVGKKIGTGLGLYVSKLLIDKFGGKIGVESEKGKGSNFWFELPLKK